MVDKRTIEDIIYKISDHMRFLEESDAFHTSSIEARIATKVFQEFSKLENHSLVPLHWKMIHNNGIDRAIERISRPPAKIQFKIPIHMRNLACKQKYKILTIIKDPMRDTFGISVKPV